MDTLALYDYVRCGTWGIGSRHLACKTRSLVRVTRRDRPLALHPGTCSFLSELSRVPSGREGTVNPVNGRHPHASAEWQLSPLRAGWSAPHSACPPVGQSRALVAPRTDPTWVATARAGCSKEAHTGPRLRSRWGWYKDPLPLSRR